ncbi:MAG: hypothetical protein QW279_12980, partial [Candidatus Jordarchaeaceae archaeon]
VESAQSNYSRELAELVCTFFKQWKYPVCVIYGNPDTGKTDTALLFAEIAKNENVLDYFASNINTYGSGERITSLDRLDYWFKNQVGRKLFILDEAGVHDDSRNPLSQMNKRIRHEIFIIRKFKGHVIFILQELEDLDKWKNSELTGMMIKKQVFDGEYVAKIKCKWMEELTVVRDFPKTNIRYDTLDISPFTLEEELSESDLQLKGIPNQVAYLYCKTGNFAVIAKTLKDQTGKDWKREEVKRALQQYLRQTLRGTNHFHI